MRYHKLNYKILKKLELNLQNKFLRKKNFLKNINVLKSFRNIFKIFFFNKYYLLKVNNFFDINYFNFELYEYNEDFQNFFSEIKNNIFKIIKKKKSNDINYFIYNEFRLRKKIKKKRIFFRKNNSLLNFIVLKRFKFFYGGIKKKILKKILLTSLNKKGLSYFLDVFFRILESRLDIFLYRLGYFKSIYEIRFFIKFGHIFINNKKVTYISQKLNKLDLITFSKDLLLKLKNKFKFDFFFNILNIDNSKLNFFKNDKFLILDKFLSNKLKKRKFISSNKNSLIKNKLLFNDTKNLNKYYSNNSNLELFNKNYGNFFSMFFNFSIMNYNALNYKNNRKYNIFLINSKFLPKYKRYLKKDNYYNYFFFLKKKIIMMNKKNSTYGCLDGKKLLYILKNNKNLFLNKFLLFLVNYTFIKKDLLYILKNIFLIKNNFILKKKKLKIILKKYKKKNLKNIDIGNVKKLLKIRRLYTYFFKSLKKKTYNLKKKLIKKKKNYILKKLKIKNLKKKLIKRKTKNKLKKKLNSYYYKNYFFNLFFFNLLSKLNRKILIKKIYNNNNTLKKVRNLKIKRKIKIVKKIRKRKVFFSNFINRNKIKKNLKEKIFFKNKIKKNILKQKLKEFNSCYQSLLKNNNNLKILTLKKKKKKIFIESDYSKFLKKKNKETIYLKYKYYLKKLSNTNFFLKKKYILKKIKKNKNIYNLKKKIKKKTFFNLKKLEFVNSNFYFLNFFKDNIRYKIINFIFKNKLILSIKKNFFFSKKKKNYYYRKYIPSYIEINYRMFVCVFLKESLVLDKLYIPIFNNGYRIKGLKIYNSLNFLRYLKNK